MVAMKYVFILISILLLQSCGAPWKRIYFAPTKMTNQLWEPKYYGSTPQKTRLPPDHYTFTHNSEKFTIVVRSLHLEELPQYNPNELIEFTVTVSNAQNLKVFPIEWHLTVTGETAPLKPSKIESYVRDNSTVYLVTFPVALEYLSEVKLSLAGFRQNGKAVTIPELHLKKVDKVQHEIAFTL